MQKNAAAADHLVRADLTGLRVLIVDRHSNARDSLRLMLASLSITKVHGASSSVEALRQVRASPFDVVFSDYLLGDGRDGQQLLEELRVKHLIPLSTVFFIVTSERGYHNVVSVAELTPDDYLIKPFTAEQLQNRLARALYAKKVLSPILRELDAAAYGKALAACERLLAGDNDFYLETLRHKGEILNLLGRHEESIALFREILATRPLPWAKMGLAAALRATGQLDEAEALARELLRDHPHFLAAHDFLAALLEQKGELDDARKVLAAAAEISPHNTGRQRIVGEVAARSGHSELAEKAFQSVLTRTRGSSLSTADDYANLSRALLDGGKAAAARSVAQEMRRDRRWDPTTEVAASIVESLCHAEEGEPDKARAALDRALLAAETLGEKDQSTLALPEKIAVDLAHACLASGESEKAGQVLRQVAAEHQENAALLDRMREVFDRTENADAGRAILEEVSREIIEINNRGVLTAGKGDLAESVRLLCEAADRIPNIQFMVNATSAIFTLLDRHGWQAELAERALGYLLRAQQRDPRHSRVIAAGELFQAVAQKYGINAAALRQQVADSLKG